MVFCSRPWKALLNAVIEVQFAETLVHRRHTSMSRTERRLGSTLHLGEWAQLALPRRLRLRFSRRDGSDFQRRAMLRGDERQRKTIRHSKAFSGDFNSGIVLDGAVIRIHFVQEQLSETNFDMGPYRFEIISDSITSRQSESPLIIAES
jgi:hypothetical protein